MQGIIAIVDGNFCYAESLANYINMVQRLPYPVFAYRDVEDYRQQTLKHDVELCILSLQIYKENKIDSSKLILITEDRYIEAEGLEDIKIIYKYISADQMIREILEYYKNLPKQNELRAVAAQKTAIGIYSPVHRCGKTEAAFAISMILRDRARTLLISLDEYQGLLSTELQQINYDLSDVLYAYKQGGFSFGKVSASVFANQDIEMIPPARYAEDIAQLQMEELKELLENIFVESYYRYVVIDFGCMGKAAVELLELCDRIYMPCLMDDSSLYRVDEFLSYVSQIGREGLSERIIRCELNYAADSYIRDRIASIKYSPIGDYWREVLLKEEA